MPKFRLIESFENNLVGPKDPRPHINTAGNDQGTYVRFSESVTEADPRLNTNGGELFIPPSRGESGINIDWLNQHLAVVLEGEEPWLFSPEDLKDFLQITIFDSAGFVVRKYLRPAIFNPENFIQNRYLQMFNSQFSTAIQVNDLGWSGPSTVKEVFRIVYEINPKHGESNQISTIIEFYGHNLKILPFLFWYPITPQDRAPELPWNKVL